ncbi:MAG: TIGR03905 family TSCPD domain-containing protein [Treponema sp.]|nr:TIGR03905 family TSCPD domain-containing protein [Treponema sp.]MCL2252798.1 TIGR03905 family TSCPD domain-containing protein [Treponema sp.]
MRYTYKTKGTCSTEIQFDINDNVITNISFTNGCNGNLKALSSLADGLTVEEIIKKCKGIDCVSKGTNRGTSCADQLALAVEKASSQ